MSKILIITLEYPPQVGGIASYIFNYAQVLAGDKIIYAPRLAGDSAFDQTKQLKVIRRSPYWILWPRWLRMLFQIGSIIKQEKITELHIHHVLPVGYIGYWFLKRKKISYTLFLHGTDFNMATKNKFKANRFHTICSQASRTVVNSEFLKTKLLARFDDLKNVIVVNPGPGSIFFNGVDEAALAKRRAELALTGKKVILTVARLAEGKGYPHLIRVMPEILKSIPNLVWIIIGNGPKKKNIMDLIQNHSLQNVVRFLGTVAYADLPFYYHLANAFVLLTHPDEVSEEGWGTVFLEAAASDLPVVAGRVGGVEEAVLNLETGLVVDVHQDKAVVNAIVEILKNPEFAKQMGQVGKARVLSEFTWEKQITKLGN